jgi:serine/threonine protein kinase
LSTHAKPPFRKCLLSSGLISAPDLEQIMVGLRKQLPPVETEVPDAKIAATLVERKYLTKFQANQLLAGHAKLSLGPYIIQDSLGQGGMGQVFLAKHQMLGRLVAIKVLPRSKTSPEAIASFMREIQNQAKLDHDHLVRAIDAGHDGNVYYLVCEYIPGADLRRFVRERGPLGMIEAANVITQAARALDYAHQSGLLHRDVKPGNILVTPDGLAKVSDLGLAGWLHDSDDPRAGKIVGTADYLSPEQIQTPLKVTAQSDVYSLGCSLYYAVTGKVPFPGGTTREKAKRHCEDMPIHPRVLNPNLSERFVAVLAAMMAKKTSDRLRNMGEVIEKLSPWVAQREAGLPSDSAEWRMESPTVDVLDGNQDTEPSDSDIKAGLSSQRLVPPRVMKAPSSNSVWTIPEDLNAIPGSQSQSQVSMLPDVIFEDRPSNQAWMIPVLLGLVALLAVGLVIMIVMQAMTMK